VRQVRDLSCGPFQIVLELEVRRVRCRSCGWVKRERLADKSLSDSDKSLSDSDNPRYTKRFAYYTGRRCRQASIRDVPGG